MCMGVDGCGCPSFSSTSCITLAFCALRMSAQFQLQQLMLQQFENRSGDMNCAIDDYQLSVTWITTKEEVTSCTISCLEGTEVGGIRVYIEDHVGSPISDFCIRVHPHVVKELVHTCKGFFSWGTLLCGGSRRCHENGWADCLCVV
jgi:hypothetical protein